MTSSTPPRRRAKILATLGPSSASEEVLTRMVEAGLSAVRLNFSHGTHEQHAASIALVRKVAARTGAALPIVQDLQGPKIRIGTIPGGRRELKRDETIRFGIDPSFDGRADALFVDYAGFARDVRPGHHFLINDGLLELEVLGTDGGVVEAKVLRGGSLWSRNGVNLPGTELSLPPLSEKDVADLRFGLEAGVDAVAVSFVRRGEDLELARLVMLDAGRVVPIFAKIETPAAVVNLEGIAEMAEGLLVARGDLGVELPPEQVPGIQKKVLAAASHRGIPAITATQMLESMIDHARPTRAEASDVANAVFDGSDCLMLSGETARGQFPVETVAMMDRIIREAEGLPEFRRRVPGIAQVSRFEAIPEAVGGAAAFAAERVGAKAIVCFTLSGSMARLLAAWRPTVPIVAVAPTLEMMRPLDLVWGLAPILTPRDVDHHEDFVAVVDEELVSRGFVKPGDLVVILMGSPPKERPRTNLMRIHRVRGGPA
jgi:pyruvate kinase